MSGKATSAIKEITGRKRNFEKTTSEVLCDIVPKARKNHVKLQCCHLRMLPYQALKKVVYKKN